MLSTLLGVAVCLPVSAVPADAAQRQAGHDPPRDCPQENDPTYSATTSNARKSRLARARASVRARERARLRSLQALQEAMTPRFKTDADGQVMPDVRAAAAIVFNPITGQVLYEENSQDKRSIASITKVMTALVYLEDNPDLSTEITIERSDVYAASTTYLKARDRVTASELLHLLLIPSDNAAARALARTSHGGMASFIERMNEKAIELGLQNTSFADPSGLNANNVSSAFDLSHLITFAASDDRICGDHAHADLHRRDQPPDDPDPQHQSHRHERRRRGAWRGRPASSASRATAWRRCCASRRATRSPSSCSARRRTTAASGRRATFSAGSTRRRAGFQGPGSAAK